MSETVRMARYSSPEEREQRRHNPFGDTLFIMTPYGPIPFAPENVVDSTLVEISDALSITIEAMPGGE